MACTQLSGDAMPEVIDYELPEIKTSTIYTNSVKCSYFVTKTGTVFVWPPYIYNNELYVNGDTKLVDENGNAYTPESGEVYTKRGEKNKIFIFEVDNSKIVVGARAQLAKDPLTLQDHLNGVFAVNDEVIFIEYPDGSPNYLGIWRSPCGLEHFVLFNHTVSEQ